MKSSPRIWPSILIGLSPFVAVIASLAVLLVSGILFLLLVYLLGNSSFLYNAREDLDACTGKSISADSRIEHFEVRNFFFLDGPDYYYELTLTPADRGRLISLFSPGGQTEALNGNADQFVPAAWQNGSRSIQRYCLHRPDKSQVLLLAVDDNSDNAWLVIENF
jgi:hypothetical protein